MNLFNMRGYVAIVGQVIAALSCLADDSRNPVTDPASKVVTTNSQRQTAKLLLPAKRVMVSVEEAHWTCAVSGVLFQDQRSSPPPWKNGNQMSLRFRKASVPAVPSQIEEWRIYSLTDPLFGFINYPIPVPEEWETWRVVNMHAENFFEVARRQEMSSVEVQLLVLKVQELGRPERMARYAVVTDARIPRNWYLSEPQADHKTAREFKAAYPNNFRTAD